MQGTAYCIPSHTSDVMCCGLYLSEPTFLLVVASCKPCKSSNKIPDNNHKNILVERHISVATLATVKKKFYITATPPCRYFKFFETILIAVFSENQLKSATSNKFSFFFFFSLKKEKETKQPPTWGSWLCETTTSLSFLPLKFSFFFLFTPGLSYP